MKPDQGTGFVPGPFMFSSHEVTFPKQGLEQLPLWQLSRSQTAKQPNQMQELIRPKFIQTIHIGAYLTYMGLNRHVFRGLAINRFLPQFLTFTQFPGGAR